MRCKCCDDPNTAFTLDDWYCRKCVAVIKRIIREDKNLPDDVVDKEYWNVNKD